MNVHGNRINRKTMPVSSTIIEKTRPRSVSNVMSPKPSVDITVRVQYSPVSQVCSCPSRSMSTWNSTE